MHCFWMIKSEKSGLEKLICANSCIINCAKVFIMQKELSMETREVIRFVRDMKLNDHAILFYDTLESKHTILFNFLSAGLEEGKGALYICSEEAPEQIRREMEAFGLDVKKFEKENALKIYNYDEWYIEDGKAESVRMLAHATQACENFQKSGLKGMRGAGEMGCFFEHDLVRELLRYEYALHRVLKIPAEIICAYSIYDINISGYTEVIMPLVRAHRLGIFTGSYGFVAHKPENVEDSDVEKLLQIKI